MDYEGKILRLIKENTSIEEFLKPEFVESLRNNFDGFDVVPIALSVVIEKDNVTQDNITLIHKNKDYADNNQILIDLDDPKNLKKILDSLKEV